MTEMFRVTPIEGKGLGIIATKFIKRGTLILKEVPQIPHVERPTSMEVDLWKRYIKTLIKLFYQMSEPDQEEYLKLHNRYEGEFFVDECFIIVRRAVMAEEKDKQKAEKILKIYGIFRTNKFVNGVKIKTSRFNHSCSPNATASYAAGSKCCEGIYATYDIKEGTEITFMYHEDQFLSMRKRAYRQKKLSEMGFTCFCDLCKKQDESATDVNVTEIETKIEELIEEIKKLNDDMSAACKGTTPMMIYLQYPPDKCRRHIECYKQLYKLGKERKAPCDDMYQILRQGHKAAEFEWQICCANDLPKEMEEFKKEGINFAKSLERFVKFLGEALVDTDFWKKCQQNFEKTIIDVYKEG